ncbi:MAG: hypothetical protein CO093_08105 [Alphaproteobacteria bacterium CG_4_9_14_3_um_filter_47_13]|nr:MAG: hypothetical protein CO093_08105 [Alphaproteobacteria bacterium CG_4_9_14_3_um_filter_47_13]
MRILICITIFLFQISYVHAQTKIISEDSTIQKLMRQKNVDKSLKYPDIWFRQGEKYYYGQEETLDYERAYQYWQEAAEKNNYAPAQYGLGLTRLYGRGVSKNYKEALIWFSKAAAQNYEPAFYRLGALYYEGLGMEKRDPKQARNWFHRAALKGDLDATYALGLIYYNGDGMEKDYVNAFRLWLRCAENNNADAQFNIGTLYENKKGVELDIEKAKEWYVKAAEQGHEGAIEALEALGY